MDNVPSSKETVHNKLAETINGLLSSNNSDNFHLIEEILSSDAYQITANSYYDLYLFKSSYPIFKFEKKNSITPTLYDSISSIEEYEMLRRDTLYLFRRIATKCPTEDIAEAFGPILNHNVSYFFIIQMLQELDVSDKGYVCLKLADLYLNFNETNNATILSEFAQSNYKNSLVSSFKLDLAYGVQHSKPYKISFITCVNDERVYEECLYYINRLLIPDECRVETLGVTAAHSMTSGYNEGMNASGADIKIYLHQDVQILNPLFLYEIIRLFDSNPEAGMIGLVGSKSLPEDCIMWHGDRVGRLYGPNDKMSFSFDGNLRAPTVTEVEAIDGFMMITNKDIPWREDLFDGWDFYDVSQSAEFRKQGLKVIVPDQSTAWVAHDDGMTDLSNYEKYRNIFLSEYKHSKE